MLQCQVIFCQALQGFHLGGINVVPPAFGKQIQEKRLIACLKSEQAPPSPTLALSRHGDPFLEQARSEISIDQSFIHLNYCLANMDVCQSVASSQPCERF